jgi:hypothetical protein
MRSIRVSGAMALALVLVACMGTPGGRGPSSTGSAVTDSLGGRWSVVGMRSGGLIKEAAQIAGMIVTGMDVELAGSEIIVHWGKERRRVGRCVRGADVWTVAETEKGDLIFGGATLHATDGGLELRRPGTTLVLAREGARSHRRAVCWFGQTMVVMRQSCLPGEEHGGTLP